MLKDRNRVILNMILSEHKTLATSQLSDSLSLSQRTIRNDLDAIDDFLVKNDLSKLKRKGGISFSGTEEERVIAAKLVGMALSGSHLPENRQHRIISILLSTSDYTTYHEIAQKLDVSKSTAINDINKIRSYYPYQSASIKVVPHRGLRFVGDEIDIRESVVSFLFGKSSIHEIFKMLHPGSEEESYAKCLKSIAKQFNKRLSDNAFIRLLLYITVSSVRIRTNQMIFHSPLPDFDVRPDCLVAAETIIAEIRQNEYSHNLVEKGEFEYLARLIEYYFTGDMNNRAEVQFLLLKLVSGIDKLLNMNLIEDTELLKVLDDHIQAIVGKKALFLASYEDIYSQLSELYFDLYEAVNASAHLIEEFLGRKLSKVERTHLIMPFAEAIQRKHTLSVNRKDIFVVCSAGLVTSRLLCYQLTSMFEINIVGAIDYNQLNESLNHSEIDFIVTTVPLGYVNKPFVLVSAFLTAQNIKELKAHLPTKVIDNNLFARLLEIIERNCDIRDHVKLAEGIADVLNIKGVANTKNTTNLCDVLPASNIRLDVKCKDWREAVKYAGTILCENGYTCASYTSEMVQNVQKTGSYIVISEGVALPHAGLKSVKRVGMVLLRLEKPVFFGNDDLDPVDLIFALCTPTKTAHLEALKQFFTIVRDENMLTQIRNANNAEEVSQVLRKVSYV